MKKTIKVILVIALAIALMKGYEATQAKATCPIKQVQVQPGQTMWKIALANCGGEAAPIEEIVHKMIKLNNNTEVIHPGDIIQLP